MAPQRATLLSGAAGAAAAAALAAHRGRPRVVLIATGSVAGVKVPELVAELCRFAEVVLVLTDAGTTMAGAVAARYAPSHAAELARLQAEGSLHVLRDSDEWEGYQDLSEDAVVHVELRKWADLAVVAPCSANTLAKLACGLCDNLATCLMRAWDPVKPVVVAPAMNTLMWEHPCCAQHLGILESWGYRLVPPASKRLACGDVGRGALAPVAEVVEAARRAAEGLAERRGRDGAGAWRARGFPEWAPARELQTFANDMLTMQKRVLNEGLQKTIASVTANSDDVYSDSIMRSLRVLACVDELARRLDATPVDSIPDAQWNLVLAPQQTPCERTDRMASLEGMGVTSFSDDLCCTSESACTNEFAGLLEEIAVDTLPGCPYRTLRWPSMCDLTLPEMLFGSGIAPEDTGRLASGTLICVYGVTVVGGAVRNTSNMSDTPKMPAVTLCPEPDPEALKRFDQKLKVARGPAESMAALAFSSAGPSPARAAVGAQAGPAAAGPAPRAAAPKEGPWGAAVGAAGAAAASLALARSGFGSQRPRGCLQAGSARLPARRGAAGLKAQLIARLREAAAPQSVLLRPGGACGAGGFGRGCRRTPNRRAAG
ncbi:unnamed protein product [Prorocentrum cordatum]|uniref:Flavoprotein domain-containing protein n=1 Tax=Prorocentrum cordatum TaxID=2364126 RepID=A0ABN9WED2_9DINO|nr:unnamed protein product [Polarella glacialis]